MAPRAFIIAVFALAGLLAGCGNDDIDTETTQDTVEEAAEDTRQAAERAFAELRTGGERLVDEIQTRNAPQAKEQLLERCRDVLERLREADSDQAGRVDDLCNRIRDTDVSNSEAWNEIRQEIEKLQ